MIRQLTILTERGRITWRCTDYNPLDLMPDLQEGKPETAYFAHIVKAEGEYNGQSFELEIGEHLTIPGNKGSIDVDLNVTRAGRRVTSYTWDDFSNEAQVEFANVVIPQLVGSEAVKLGFDQSRYSTAFSPDYIAAHPLTALGAALFREHRLVDYPLAVADPVFREKLLNEQNH